MLTAKRNTGTSKKRRPDGPGWGGSPSGSLEDSLARAPRPLVVVVIAAIGGTGFIAVIVAITSMCVQPFLAQLCITCLVSGKRGHGVDERAHYGVWPAGLDT